MWLPPSARYRAERGSPREAHTRNPSSRLKKHTLVARKVGKCQFLFTAAAAAYSTAFARSLEAIT